MHAVDSTTRLGRTSWRTKCCAGAAFAMVLSVTTIVSSTTPSLASSLKSAGSSSTYCKLLSAYDKKQNAANKALTTPGAEKAAFEAAIRNLKPEEAVVLNVAPSSLQSSYKTLFKDINLLYADLAKANYNFLKLTKAETAKFEALSRVMAPASAKISAYNKNVCGVKD